MKTIGFKFKHVSECQGFSNSYGITICTQYDKDDGLLYIGYAIFNPKDGYFVKKIGNQISQERCVTNPIVVKVDQLYFSVSHFQLTWLAMCAINHDIQQSRYDVQFTKYTKKFIWNLTRQTRKLYKEHLMSSFSGLVNESLLTINKQIVFKETL